MARSGSKINTSAGKNRSFPSVCFIADGQWCCSLGTSSGIRKPPRPRGRAMRGPRSACRHVRAFRSGAGQLQWCATARAPPSGRAGQGRCSPCGRMGEHCRLERFRRIRLAGKRVCCALQAAMASAPAAGQCSKSLTADMKAVSKESAENRSRAYSIPARPMVARRDGSSVRRSK